MQAAISGWWNLDRSLQAEAACGTIAERSLQMTVGCMEEYCNRSYLLYLPCTDQKQDQEAVQVVPLLFAIHCYGCTANTMKHWHKEAEQYGFALVIPQGIHAAFNAKVCCGEPAV